MTQVQLIDSRSTLEFEGDDTYRVHQQVLTDEYLRELKDLRNDFHWNHQGFTKVASVPAAILDRWYSEGFDYIRASINEILERLRFEEFHLMDLTGGKRV